MFVETALGSSRDGPEGERAERELLAATEALLAESLRLWRLDGTVGADGTELAVASGGRHLKVRRVPADDLFGWRVRNGQGAERPCASVLGLLSTVRRLLDPDWAEAPRLRAGFMASAP